uniref:Uncharacterized protein n=1 Tax=Arundo donax TaxID=35708 RepID=A0A0A9F166_ARUDO
MGALHLWFLRCILWRPDILCLSLSFFLRDVNINGWKRLIIFVLFFLINLLHHGIWRC